jgi:cytochrome P450
MTHNTQVAGPHTQTAKVPILPPQKRPPGPHENWLIGSARTIQRDPLGFNVSMFQRYGNVAAIRFLMWPTYMIYHPQDVKHVLQENHRNYSKDTYLIHFLRPLLGQGLFSNDGPSWLQQRRLMQPAFHRKQLATFGMLMTGATTSLLEHWQNATTRDQPLDVAREMMRLTLRIVGQALFSIDLSDETDTVGQAFTALLTSISDYIFNPVPPLNIPTPRNRRIRKSIRTLDGVVQEIITAHRRLDADTSDLLSMLLLARDEETGEGMNDRQVRDEVMTLLLAGHETTSNALTWTWYLLSQHPDAESRLHAELEQVLGGSIPTVEDLPRLPYTRMVLEEALRLYPPVVGFNRKTLRDDEVGGYVVPANTLIWLSPYMTHRHPDFWENPDVFDPERFSPERSTGRPHFAYFPFGGGPRLCIGSTFAMMEAQLILATVAQRYRLRLVPDHQVEPQVMLTLRPRHGLAMTLHERAVK